MLEVRPIMPGFLTGVTTSTAEDRWNSAIQRSGSRHGWMSLQRSEEKPS